MSDPYNLMGATIAHPQTDEPIPVLGQDDTHITVRVFPPGQEPEYPRVAYRFSDGTLEVARRWDADPSNPSEDEWVEVAILSTRQESER